MPNIIELNLLENKSIVATMQGYHLGNENSYKIIAGEENATKFKIVSVPNQYKDKNFTIEMVNAKNYGINETQIENISNYEFSLPVGMAVAGYSYILFRCKYTENGKQVVVPFQPLKVKVWNTIPQWQDYVDKTTNLKVVDGYLILTENGNEYNLGYVQGEKGEKGDAGKDGKDHSVEIAEIKSDIADLYLLSNATVTGTEEIKEAYTARQTANGLSGLIDGALTKVLKVEGNTVKSRNIFKANVDKTIRKGVYIDGATQTIVISEGSYAFSVSMYQLPVSIPTGKKVSITAFFEKGGFEGTRLYVGTYHNGTTKNWTVELAIPAQDDCTNKVFSSTKTTEMETTDIWLFLNNGFIATSEIKFRIVVVVDEDAPTYFIPYFAGLKNASFKGIKSTGKNLFNILSNFESNQYTVSGNTLTILESAENYYVACAYKLPAGNYFLSGIGGSIAIESYVNGVATNPVYGVTLTSGISFTVPENAELVRIFFYSTAQGGGSYQNIMLSFDETAPFEPYVEDTLELPAAIDSGLGTTIDFENRKIINRGVDIVLTGNETIGYVEEGTYPEGNVFTIIGVLTSPERLAKYVCTDAVQLDEDRWQDGGLWVGVNNTNLYWLNPHEYLGLAKGSDIEQDKSSLIEYLKQRYDSGNPVKIRYISNIPEELPLSTNKSKYKEWVGGSETVVQGTTDNSKYGAENTATNIYAIKKGVTE